MPKGQKPKALDVCLNVLGFFVGFSCFYGFEWFLAVSNSFKK